MSTSSQDNPVSRLHIQFPIPGVLTGGIDALGGLRVLKLLLHIRRHLSKETAKAHKGSRHGMTMAHTNNDDVLRTVFRSPDCKPCPVCT